MSTIVPDLLLQLPPPQFREEHVDLGKGKLLLTTEEAAVLARDYFAEVSAFIRSRSFDLNTDIIPAIRFGLRVFMADNVTGELVPAEREMLAVLYERYGGGGSPSAADTAANENEEADEEAGKSSAAAAAQLRERYFQRLLTSDGELPSPCVRLSALLLSLLGIVYVRDGGEGEGSSPLIPYTCLWRLRVLMRHQLCLTHRAHSVFTEISYCIDALTALPDDEQSVEQLIEVGHVQNYYHRRDIANVTFRRAMQKSGLQVEESAMMGVRTRWQQHQIVQMILDAKSSLPVPEASMHEEQPKTVMSELDGHDLLDRPRAMPDAEPLAMTPLHPLDKAIILALCMDIRNQNPENGLTRHYMSTYVERLIADPAPSPFIVRCQTLLLRARLEQRRNRVQERAFMQLTELVDQFGSRRSPEHMVFARTDSEYLYCVDYPSIWKLKSEYADFSFEEGLFKTALDMYEQVQDWEKIIECCKQLDKRRRAESLAREKLETDPLNPMLWVALGEATRDEAHLWKAWEVSGHRMAAPMRSLARLALDREQYDKVIEYFDEAVKINPVFGGDWFSLGFASLKQQKWGRGGEAFTRVCQIDPNDAFAWNNLASIMLRQGKLRPAFNAMSQALRNNRRDWRMWQNYFEIGCSLKEVSETTNALSIALDIAKRSIHLESGTMHIFVRNTIAYLKGEIPGSSLEAEDTAESKASQLCYRSLASAVETTDADAIPHLRVAAVEGGEAAADDEDDAVDYSALEAFGAEADLPEYHSAAADREAAQRHEETLARIRARHRDRVCALFVRLLDMFVTDPELYDCAAELFTFTNGPMKGFYYREKELRACQQRDQWERTPELFRRTVQCLQAMRKDVDAAFSAARAALEQPPAAAPVGDDAAAAAVPVSGAQNEAGANEEAEEEDAGKAIVSAYKELLNNVNAVIEATEDHMASTDDHDSLRNLLATVRESLREAKAFFV